MIAEWDGAGFNRIHDFHVYSSRDAFIHPRLEGVVGFHRVDERRMDVNVERIHNPRDVNNVSGSLSLELWALTEPYTAGDFQGHALAGMILGTLAGGASWEDSVYTMQMTPPPPGTYTLVLMLREWAGNGYVTRDHRNFDHPLTFPLVMTATEQSGKPVADVVPAGPAVIPVRSSGPAPDAAEAGPVGSPDTEAGQRASKDVGESPVSPKDEALSFSLFLEDWKQFAGRLRDRFRKQLSL